MALLSLQGFEVRRRIVCALGCVYWYVWGCQVWALLVIFRITLRTLGLVSACGSERSKTESQLIAMLNSLGRGRCGPYPAVKHAERCLCSAVVNGRVARS